MLTKQNSVQKPSHGAQTGECRQDQWLTVRRSLNKQRQRLIDLIRIQESRLAQGPLLTANVLDCAAETQRQAKTVAMLRLWKAMQVEVERAVTRLDNGTYGVCEYCGQPIPEERLKALPSAVLCAGCSQLQARNVRLIVRGTERVSKTLGK